MAAKKTAKELINEARAKYRAALEAAKKVEAREKLELGDKLKAAAEKLNISPEELLRKLEQDNAATPAPLITAAPPVEAPGDEAERYND
jgi:hypothetical protein